MIIAGVDQGGLERAARLFPVRTGVPVSLLGRVYSHKLSQIKY